MPIDLPVRPPLSRSARRGFLRRSAGTVGLLVAGGAAPGRVFAELPLADDAGWQAVPGTGVAPPATVTAPVPAPVPAPAQVPPPAAVVEVVHDVKRLKLVNAHTGERFDDAYRVDDNYIDESLARLAHLMRDHRADREHAIDPALYDTLHALHARLDTDEPFRVLSGYRTPETNAKLRSRSTGVAKFSLHMEGRAADIHLPGSDMRAVQQEALALAAGGVGYYARSGFVHLDTGQVRAWQG